MRNDLLEEGALALIDGDDGGDGDGDGDGDGGDGDWKDKNIGRI